MKTIFHFSLLLALSFTASAQEPPTFSVETEAVYVDAFVTEANRPVAGLTEADFELKGVRRAVSDEKL